MSATSQISNEDIGPLNFNGTTRGRQRRTSNFLELPGNIQKKKIIPLKNGIIINNNDDDDDRGNRSEKLKKKNFLFTKIPFLKRATKIYMSKVN